MQIRLWSCLSAIVLGVACGSGSEDGGGGPIPPADAGDASYDGSAASGGSGGSGGSGATGGSGGSTGGTGGSTGGSGGATGGSAGSGSGGMAGFAGGSAGASTGGSAGASTGGSAGASTGGAGGMAGMAGSAGADAGPQCQSPADCDNGNYCDGAEDCVAGSCVAGTPIICPDDGASCTLEICEESSRSCKAVIQDSACQDTLFCNGVEHCDPSNSSDPQTGCVAGTPPSCSDGITCTIDACDETNDRCNFIPSNAACNDGAYCNGAEVCDPVNGAPGSGCVVGVSVDCEDGFACTQDSCNEGTDSCDHATNSMACDNGVFCDGQETCQVGQGCVAGGTVQCPSDGVSCTLDSCNESLKQCTSVADNNLCPSGQFCSSGGCVGGTPCTTDSQCDNGVFCDGEEFCDKTTNPGVCKPKPMTVPNCNDSIDCTFDQCDESADQCSHAPINAACSDGDVCNGIESCVVGQGCVAGNGLSCDDGVACTFDSCVGSLGCLHQPVDQSCSDGKFCNGAEKCNVTLGCLPGTPPSCGDDGIACTTASCSDTAGACVHTPDDALCGCGQTCSASQGGCGNYCKVATCQGKVYQCGDCLDNDGDCRIDSNDTQCIGVCDNNESGFKGNIPGQNNSPCKADCYFDQDTGAGNDDCYWSHKCDPYEVAPKYDPEGSKCSYDPNAGIPGTSQSCSQLYSAQSSLCGSYCGPLTPNGCDCFGCCAIPGAATTVYLGSEDSAGNGTCTLANVGDPSKCRPCTQVGACLNTCDTCEICLGKPTLPPSCTTQSCPSGAQPCGQAGQLACPDGEYCVTGCCQPVPG